MSGMFEPSGYDAAAAEQDVGAGSDEHPCEHGRGLPWRGGADHVGEGVGELAAADGVRRDEVVGAAPALLGESAHNELDHVVEVDPR